ncbi:sodium:proton antiporter [Brevibacillus sp. SYP-B805]|uniref:cation:proton antiporter n=1 Tax=Brevibacillus sp. SYP-B805 TaxID=1578199 RepID=UPI0013ECB29D|nr:sodium:proton antiporter [Brevibacillus sp. SYP-B805]NGQ94621.1 sodium:proton antiporter [Brevibacillus sp. SYP-B805]
MEQAAEIVPQTLYVLMLVLISGMLSGKIAQKFRLPDVVFFLLIGMLVGPVLHLLNVPSDTPMNQLILVLGATLILFDGGRLIRLETLRKVWLTVVLLSVPGVFITALIVGLAAAYFLGIPLMYALLLASIIASTDPATLIPVFKQVKIRAKVKETVESESAFNDATGSILTFSLLAVVMGTESVSIGASIIQFLKSSVGGIATGALVSTALVYLVGHRKVGFLRDYTTIAMIVAAIGSYYLADSLRFSGFMATFVAGLIWGNAAIFGIRMDEKAEEMDHVAENLTVIKRMLIFILLGSQVDFQAIFQYFWSGLLVILVFMFIARPITVFACALPDRRARWTKQEMLFMCWVRETGVIPAALSGMVVGMGVPHADAIASVTFLAILVTILLQASTTPYVARKLGIEEVAEKAVR